MAELASPNSSPIKSSSTSTSSSSGDGDWTCDECGNLNFARRSLCNRCQKGKAPSSTKKRKLGTEIGKAAAEKSRGLFSADDWQCNKCGNVNWARRQQCNVCNAPKFGEVEERTGLGGGYNDRGIVEYKERVDSDDDYDEFGRRKKPKEQNVACSDGNNVKKSKDKREEKVGVDEEGDEDEDDEDGDNDLSKYDLSEWGDDDNIRNNKKNEKKSRSRSRSPNHKNRR